MDDVQTDVMTDGTDDVWTEGNFTRKCCRDFTAYFSSLLQWNFDRGSADHEMDGMDDILSDCMTDESDDVWVGRNFPRSWTIG